jgi:hypothetical protein
MMAFLVNIYRTSAKVGVITNLQALPLCWF